MKKKTFSLVLTIVVIVIALIVGGVYFAKTMSIKKDKASILSKEKLENTKGATADDGYIDITLYFGGDTGKSELIKEERLINSEDLIGEMIMQELIKGPSKVSEKSKPILPKETRLLSFSIKDGIANINLSPEAIFEMSEVQEETILKAISNSLSQLKSVSKIKITVDNQGVESLGGNYNISKPFTKDEIVTLKIPK
ncbi:GerMN domain-containing protein [Clostridium sp.]|uniref:GerMN domain-containing protein n=1 Tax=Clostridium sp. TaxID=1506 RepID=UPI003463D529